MNYIQMMIMEMYFGKWLRMATTYQEQSQAEKCALYLLQEEQKITLFVDEESDVSEWIITIYVYMEPEYSDIVDLEQWFT